MVGRIDVFGRSGEEEARNHDVDGLGDDLLLDAKRSSRVKLALIEVDGLLELEELLGLPTQVVQLSDLCSRNVRSTQRGEVERLLAAGAGQLDSAEFDGLVSTPGIGGRWDHNAIVVTSALAEGRDGVEGARRGNLTRKSISLASRIRSSSCDG